MKQLSYYSLCKKENSVKFPSKNYTFFEFLEITVILALLDVLERVVGSKHGQNCLLLHQTVYLDANDSLILKL